jgi:hypothetical protein
MPFADSVMLTVGNVPQYFFDNLVVEQTQDITKTVHSPAKQPGPVIYKDRPWERNPYFTFNGWSVLRDENTGKYMCWYEDWPIDPKEVVRRGVVYCCPAATHFATSEDGINWVKPELDYATYEGAKTNTVLGVAPYEKLESTIVFADPLETDHGKRLKLMLTHFLPGADSAGAIAGTRDGRDGLLEDFHVEIHYSGDGIKWTPYPELPRFGRHGNGLGDCYTIFVDEEAGVYRMLTRAAAMESVHYDERRPQTNSFFPPHFPYDAARMNKRRVFQSESADLVHWSRPQSILTPDDDDDNLDDSYYGMAQFKMGEVYVGFLNVLHEVPDTMDVRLVYSRDGWRWHHLNQRQPWLAGTAGSWDPYMVTVCCPPIYFGDEMLVFHGGANVRHDWWMVGLREGIDLPETKSLDEVRYSLGLATMRRDGFVSVDAGSVREGILITRVLRTGGRKLKINASCGQGGCVRVEVTDPEERVLKGFARSDCDTFSGDSTDAAITWKGLSDIPHDGVLRLRFFMRNASLYSFAFE